MSLENYVNNNYKWKLCIRECFTFSISVRTTEYSEVHMRPVTTSTSTRQQHLITIRRASLCRPYQTTWCVVCTGSAAWRRPNGTIRCIRVRSYCISRWCSVGLVSPCCSVQAIWFVSCCRTCSGQNRYTKVVRVEMAALLWQLYVQLVKLMGCDSASGEMRELERSLSHQPGKWLHSAWPHWICNLQFYGVRSSSISSRLLVSYPQVRAALSDSNRCCAGMDISMFGITASLINVYRYLRVTGCLWHRVSSPLICCVCSVLVQTSY